MMSVMFPELNSTEKELPADIRVYVQNDWCLGYTSRVNLIVICPGEMSQNNPSQILHWSVDICAHLPKFVRMETLEVPSDRYPFPNRF